MLGGDALHTRDAEGRRVVDDDLLVILNASAEDGRFKLPHEGGGDWFLELDTGDLGKAANTGEGRGYRDDYPLAARSLAIFRRPLAQDVKREAAIAPVRALRRASLRRRRRAGVVVPLFALRSASSQPWGLGDISDIPRLAGWASRAGFSVLQFLPINEVSGVDASPYAAISAFAIDPVFLSLEDCEDFRAIGGRDALPAELKAELAKAAALPRVDWKVVRAAKTKASALAFDRFRREEWDKKTTRGRMLAVFMQDHRAWIDDHALFVTIHEKFKTSWREWPRGFRDREANAMAEVRRAHEHDLLRVAWLQWQLDVQWRTARQAALKLGVDLMGDLPFMVGMDSSDVWANRHLFRLDWHVGTPPVGDDPAQDWGLPAYDWEAHKKSDFAWIKARAKRAGELFGGYRIDHALGFYRTYYRSEDGEQSGFTPPEEREQIALGERILRLMGRFGEVVAEDLGAVPGFLRPSLEKLGVPGYRVLRWEKDGDKFRDPQSWNACSVATASTHDTEPLAAWYDGLSPEEREQLKALPPLSGLDPARNFDDEVRRIFLKALYAAPSTLALLLLQDALGTRTRINTPGTVSPDNWTYRTVKSLDELLADEGALRFLRELAEETGRASPEPQPQTPARQT
jgi:4-alpha-glucanotransferase